MANTFAGKQLIDLRGVLDGRRKGSYGLHDFKGLERANTITIPSGPNPARGWFLLRRDDLTAIDITAAHVAVLTEPENGTTVTLNGLYIVGARTPVVGVTDLSSSWNAAPYLVEVADARWLLKNRLWKVGTSTAYNVRSPGYSAGFYDYSLNSSAEWTWEEMVGDIWANCGLLGTFPGLPGSVSPTGDPEGWQFPGTSVWDALTSVLDYLGCAVTCDLGQVVGSQYGIIHYGDADSGFSALQETLTGQLIEDEDPADAGAGRVPGTVTVLFHRSNKYYGTEETVRNDDGQWLANADYGVTNATGYTSPGNAVLWADFSVRFDEDGVILSADATTAATLADELMDSFIARITRGGNGEMHQIYSGCQPFITGSLLDLVSYRHRLGRADMREGWVTDIARDPRGRWLEVNDDGSVSIDKRSMDSSNTQPPDFGPSFPIYPPHIQVIRTDGSAVPSGGGSPANPYSQDLYSAFTQQLVVDTGLRDREVCTFLDLGSGASPITAYPARLIGEFNGGPLYAGVKKISGSGTTFYGTRLNVPALVNVSAASPYTISWDSVQYGKPLSGTFWTSGTDITLPVDGVYEVTLLIRLEWLDATPNTLGNVEASVFLNGTSLIADEIRIFSAASLVTGTQFTLNCAGSWNATAGDIITAILTSTGLGDTSLSTISYGAICVNKLG